MPHPKSKTGSREGTESEQNGLRRHTKKANAQSRYKTRQCVAIESAAASGMNLRRNIHSQASGTGISDDRLVALSTEHRLPAQEHVPLLNWKVSLKPEQPERTLGAEREQRVH